MSAAPVLSAEETGDSPVRHALRRLSVYLRRNLVYYSFWTLLTLGYVAAFVAFPMMVGWSIEGAMDPDLPPEALQTRFIALLGVAVARGGLRFFSRLLVFTAAREVEYEMRNDLFAHLQSLPQSFYFDWRTGDLMSRCVNDLNAVRLMLGPGLLSIVQTPVLFLGVLVAMFVLDPTLAMLVLIPYPLFIVIARVFGSTLYSRSLAVQVGLADLSNQVQEVVSGISVVKAYAMEDEQASRFKRINEELYQRALRLVWINGAMPTITGMLPAVAMWVVLMVGGASISKGEMSVAEFFIFAMYIWDLTFPTFIMGWVVALVQRGSAAMQRIDEVLSVEPSIRDHEVLEDVESLRGEIEFRGLSFRYHETDSDWALKDLRIRVPAGSSLGVVGSVGSGKTTLASVIPRLYEVDDGQVFLDGTDINRLPLKLLRSSIAMVPQDSFLFSTRLSDNIAYGLPPDAGSERIREAAEMAQLAKDIHELPEGFDTLVGERGIMLSGGQRQRTALARALALRPSILILDDTLSSVDAETESAIQSQLTKVFQGRTVVVVASRVSTVRDCDQIVVLDEGRVVEVGRHHELVAAGELYSRLASEQAASERRRKLESDLVESTADESGGAAK
ncbi:MAG TPA: ABC transporter ATP-binding protein [Myxococcales bacterium]|jgi:ATP-binding cassette subfamily B protein|nr:ABC transporter ATP-binding protein [Myxococcales bacterium]HIL02725.1 ABC transporter ATP-binding protein [Myxococcales bacterium]